MMEQTRKSLRRRRDPDSKSAAIYDAAAQLFMKNGYESVSMAMIAKRAGIAVGTVYRFHDTKLALLRAMLEDVENQFVSRMASDWGCEGTYAHRIERMCYGLFEVAKENRDLLKLLSMTTDIVFDDGSLPGDRIQGQIGIMYAEAMDAGASYQGDPQMMAAIAHGMVEGALLRWMRMGAPESFNPAEQLAAIFKDGFMTEDASRLQ